MEAKGEKVVVVANIVDEAPSKLAVAGSPELAALNNGLTNEANALKGAATLLFCLSLFQVFTLHGARGGLYCARAISASHWRTTP